MLLQLGMLNSFLFKIQTLFVKFEFYSNFVWALKVTVAILHEFKIIMAPNGLLIELPGCPRIFHSFGNATTTTVYDLLYALLIIST